MSPRSFAVALAATFAVALGIRLGTAARFVGLAAPPKASAASDQVDYEAAAWNLAQGKGFAIDQAGTPTARRPPGAAFALTPVYALAGRSFLAGRIWWALISASTCLAVAWLAWEATADRRAALLAAAVLAVVPGHFYYSMHFLSEPPFGLTLATALAATIRARSRGSTAWAAGAGALWGAAVLVRPNFAIVPALLAAGLALAPGRRPGGWTRAAALALAVALVVAPWLARNRQVLGRPTFSTIGGPTLWGANNPLVLRDRTKTGLWVSPSELVDEDPVPRGMGERARTDWMWDRGIAFMREHPADMPSLTAMKLWRLVAPFEETGNRAVYWAFALGWIATAPLVAIGAIRLLRSDRWAGLALLTPALVLVATAIVFYGCIRFRDALAPVGAVMAGVGLVAIRDRIAGRPADRRA